MGDPNGPDCWQEEGCVQMLVDMGFSQAHAERVLRDSSGNVSAAVAILLSTPEEEVADPHEQHEPAKEQGPEQSELDVDAELREVLLLSSVEEQTRRKSEELQLKEALFVSLEGPPVTQGYVLPEHEVDALRPRVRVAEKCLRMGSHGAFKEEPRRVNSAATGQQPRSILSRQPRSRGEKQRPGMLRDTGLDHDGMGPGDLESSSPVAAQDPLARTSPQRPGQASTPVSQGADSAGRPPSSGIIGIEDLDGWGSGGNNFLSPSLMPELRRASPASSSAPWLSGMASSPSGGNYVNGFSLSLKQSLMSEDANAARAAALAASLPSRPPSRSGLHPMPRSGRESHGLRPSQAMLSASRSSPLLFAGSASLGSPSAQRD